MFNVAHDDVVSADLVLCPAARRVDRADLPAVEEIDFSPDAEPLVARNHGLGDPEEAALVILLVRYRKGLVGESRRTVHLVDVETMTGDRAEAFCGLVIRAGEVERLDGICGQPCVECLRRAPTEEPPEISDTFLR